MKKKNKQYMMNCVKGYKTNYFFNRKFAPNMTNDLQKYNSINYNI